MKQQVCSLDMGSVWIQRIFMVGRLCTGPLTTGTRPSPSCCSSEKSADANARNDYYRTPLYRAAENGHEAIVKLLVEKGADAIAKDNYYRMPLHWAAGNGHDAAVKLLLKKGADGNAKTYYSLTPLQRAAENGHRAVVESLRSN
jgi:ankyrin repeat protein